MKTLFNSLLVASLLTFVGFSVSLAETTTFGRPKPVVKPVAYQSSLYTDARGMIRLAVDKQAGGAVEIRLVNTAGKEFFVQRVGKHQQKARIRFDVSGLPDGAYQVVLTNGVTTFASNVVLTTQQPGFSSRLIALK
ncbi:hypothetical protein GCM10028803_45090 [Larkinella knui]|uniref:Secretion system C-terminal sorting domain-containing protein n=1 Tax=Larkinella knui TaxID=2025310 RepID=A0A3P1CPX8_9BACT|nr:hypothetical protein [Larkinella knui]RRB15116.1 hypothetical protein EHT87_11225 [Larkinella knui]